MARFKLFCSKQFIEFIAILENLLVEDFHRKFLSGFVNEILSVFEYIINTQTADRLYSNLYDSAELKKYHKKIILLLDKIDY